MRRRAGLILLSTLTALTVATPAQAHAAAGWQCWANSYQNDGDAGGRSAYTQFLYNNSTTNQVKGNFYALDERMTLKNGTSYPVILRLFNARTGAQLGYLSAAAHSPNKIKNLDLAEDIPVKLELTMNRFHVCTATGAIT